MANLDLNKASVSDQTTIDSHEIAAKQVDSVKDQKETRWTNSDWTTYWGWFDAQPKVKNAVLMKAMWHVGKGWNAKGPAKRILENISGDGKQTFKDVLFSMDCTRRIGGDAYAEIITRGGKKLTEGDELINLKLLDPGRITEVYANTGRIKYYELTIDPEKKTTTKFDPDEIFHLSNNKIAGQIHGISDLECLRKVIIADDKSFDDLSDINTFQARPFIIYKLKTDDEDKIAAFKAKVKDLRSKGEDMFVPDDENLLSYEVVQVNPSSILMEWRGDLRNEFYRAIGLPQIIPGGAGQGTESESRVIYVAFEQLVMHEQLNIEQQVLAQLGLKIDLIHPTLIEDLIGNDEKKDAAGNFNVQQSELNPTAQNQS